MEMIEFFINRTNQHINRVKSILIKMKGFYGFSEELLKERGEDHDRSKFFDPEKIPYIYLSWWHKCKRENINYQYPANVENEVKLAVKHHLDNNSHHPESHNNINEMSTLDLVEMVCDWTAMSQEYGKDSCYSFAIENIEKWNFCNEKKEEIFLIIAELDKRLKKK